MSTAPSALGPLWSEGRLVQGVCPVDGSRLRSALLLGDEATPRSQPRRSQQMGCRGSRILIGQGLGNSYAQRATFRNKKSAQVKNQRHRKYK